MRAAALRLTSPPPRSTSSGTNTSSGKGSTGNSSGSGGNRPRHRGPSPGDTRSTATMRTGVAPMRWAANANTSTLAWSAHCTSSITRTVGRSAMTRSSSTTPSRTASRSTSRSGVPCFNSAAPTARRASGGSRANCSSDTGLNRSISVRNGRPTSDSAGAAKSTTRSLARARTTADNTVDLPTPAAPIRSTLWPAPTPAAAVATSASRPTTLPATRSASVHVVARGVKVSGSRNRARPGRPMRHCSSSPSASARSGHAARSLPIAIRLSSRASGAPMQ